MAGNRIGQSGIGGGIGQCDVRIENMYTTPIENHNPMEPQATIAMWDGDHSPSTMPRST